MPSEFNRTDDWSKFMSRMRHQFEQLLGSKPTCLPDMVQELRKHDDFITFLDIVRDRVPGVKDTDLRVLPGQMQKSRLLCLRSGAVARLLEEQKAA